MFALTRARQASPGDRGRGRGVGRGEGGDLRGRFARSKLCAHLLVFSLPHLPIYFLAVASGKARLNGPLGANCAESFRI